MIRTESISMHFGGIVALDDVSLQVERGELFSIIGPNGSGKSTFFNVVTGIYRPTSGQVYFGDEQITGRTPFDLSRRGIGRTFQNIQLFRSMTALENVMVGVAIRSTIPVLSEVASDRARAMSQGAIREKAFLALQATGLGEKAAVNAAALPYGDQKRLEIARAYATDPEILLLDEPVAGLNRAERDEMTALIRSLHESGLTIVVIDHDMRVVMSISDRIMVLNYGKIVTSGTPSAVRANPEVIAAYLGEEAKELDRA
jgi:branched-chain amino acid transport system ATP-binding protein